MISKTTPPGVAPPQVHGLTPTPVRDPRVASTDTLELVHDLRQPIALMRLLLAALANQRDVSPSVAQTLAQVTGQVAWLSELVDQWHAPSARTVRHGGPGTAAPESSTQGPSHVLDVLETVADSFAAAHPGRVTWQVHEKPWVRMPSPVLRRALTNLVDNAVRCAGPDGIVRLSVGLTGHRAYVAVDDDGPGFRPAYERTAVGLCIVTEIAAAAGGSLEVGASRRGGVRAVLRIPAIRTRPDGGCDEPAPVR